MENVKSIMNCIGVDTSGDVSVLFHMFGFFRSRVPADPCTTTTASVSLLEHVKALKGKHLHLNVIRVGIDNFTSGEIEKIDYAVYRTRKIYQTVSLGVGRVQHWDVSSADADGKDDLGSEDEAEDLTHDWTVPNNGVDVFVVENISDTDFVGISPVEGPCDKDDKDMNGMIGGEVNRDSNGFARTFAHELGHYLGLEHNHDDDECPSSSSGRANLMAQTKCADSICDSVQLTSGQGSDVRDHCFVQDGC